MIRCCIFDIGGTIFDKYSLSPLYSLKKAFKKNNVFVTHKCISKDMGLQKSKHINTLLLEKNIDDKHLESQIFEDFNEIQNESLHTCDIIPETKELISYLHKQNIKIGVTTGFNKQQTNIIQSIFENNDIFIDNYVSSECVSISRPYPYMIHKNMKDLQIDNPKSVIKIDDTNVGIQEGLNAGCYTIGVSRWSINMDMFDSPDEDDFNMLQEKIKQCRYKLQDADYIIDTIDEIPRIIYNIDKLYHIY